MASSSLGTNLQQHSFSSLSFQENESPKPPSRHVHFASEEETSHLFERHVHFAPDQLSGSHRRPDEFRKARPINSLPDIVALELTDVPFENWAVYRREMALSEEACSCLLHWEALVCLAKTIYAVFTSTVCLIASAIFCCDVQESKRISCGSQWAGLWGNIKALFCPKQAIEECWNSRIAVDRRV